MATEENSNQKNGKVNGTAVNGSANPNGKNITNGVPNTLTTRQGHPVTDNQNIRTVGNRGPATMENYPFIEKVSHFDRERIPERVVHARGAGAHGYFEAYGKIGSDPATRYTRATMCQAKGTQTPLSTSEE